MSLVGKTFPNISVDAMNEMGDTFKLNVLEEAKKNKKKYCFFGILKISPLFAQPKSILFKKHFQNLKTETQWLLVHPAILLRYISLG